MKTNSLAFFSAMFLTFGITAIDAENYAISENIMAYAAIVLGVVCTVAYIVIKRKENQQS